MGGSLKIVLANNGCRNAGIESDPNRADDPEYIVRLVGQVVRVSVETLKIVNGLPAEFS